MISMQKYEELIFLKKYSELDKQPDILTQNDINSNLLADTINFKKIIFRKIDRKNVKKQSIVEKIEEYKESYGLILEKYAAKVSEQILQIYNISMRFFLFELCNCEEDANSLQEQHHLVKKLSALADLNQYAKQLKKEYEVIAGSLYLSITFIQLQVKKILSQKKNPKEAVNHLKRFLLRTVESYALTIDYCRKIYLILVHLKVKSLNLSVGLAAKEQMLSLCEELTLNEKGMIELLTLDLKIVVLYNCLKNMLGSITLFQAMKQYLTIIYESFGMKNVKTYQEHLLQLFLAIKILIFKKGEAYCSNEVNEIGSHSYFREKVVDGQDQYMSQKFSIFLNINLDETVVALNQITRSIIRHRVASLSTVIGFKLGLDKFSQNFIELMHDSPFNNDIQTIKLCFQFLESREFAKLVNLFQIVLAAPSCTTLKERQVLVAMCGIFTGLFLQNREEALLYAKLNHCENKKQVLKEETLLQHLGFAYYNLAIHETYLENRKIYLLKALENLQMSWALNDNNYLVSYCLAKIHLMLHNYQSAYKFSNQCCKSSRGEWIPFTLLACIYYCDKKISKATIIVDELLKKYPAVKELYYIRSYLEVNRILIQIEHDEEVEAAQELSDEIFEMTKEKVLKSKAVNLVFKNLQTYYQLSLNISNPRGTNGEISSEDFFEYVSHTFSEQISGNNASDVQNIIASREGYGGYYEYEAEKILLQIIQLLLQVEQISLSEGLVKMLPESSIKNYYRASIMHLKKETDQARKEYQNVLVHQPYHTLTLINLSLIQKDISQRVHYLNIAEKMVDHSDFIFAKAMLLSDLGEYQKANQLFMQSTQIGWLELQPDLIYYY